MDGEKRHKRVCLVGGVHAWIGSVLCSWTCKQSGSDYLCGQFNIRIQEDTYLVSCQLFITSACTWQWMAQMNIGGSTHLKQSSTPNIHKKSQRNGQSVPIRKPSTRIWQACVIMLARGQTLQLQNTNRIRNLLSIKALSCLKRRCLCFHLAYSRTSPNEQLEWTHLSILAPRTFLLLTSKPRPLSYTCTSEPCSCELNARRDETRRDSIIQIYNCPLWSGSKRQRVPG